MKLKLKDIGTLKQAEIDLSKDLIILAGPNNTGKTYAAYTVYGVCDLLRKADILSYSKSFLDSADFMSRWASDSGEVKIESYINDFINSVTESFNQQSSQYLRNIFATDESKFSKSEIQIVFDTDLLKAKLLDFPNSIHKGLNSISVQVQRI